MARLVLGGGGKAAHGLRWGQLRGRKLGWVGRRSAAPAGSRLRGALWERGFPPETSRAARLPSALPRRDPREGRKEERREGRKEPRPPPCVGPPPGRPSWRRGGEKRGRRGGERGCAPGAGGERGGNGSSWDRSRHRQAAEGC